MSNSVILEWRQGQAGGGQERGAAGSRAGLSAKELGGSFLDREGSGAGRKRSQELWVWKQAWLECVTWLWGINLKVLNTRQLSLGSRMRLCGTVALL